MEKNKLLPIMVGAFVLGAISFFAVDSLVLQTSVLDAELEELEGVTLNLSNEVGGSDGVEIGFALEMGSDYDAFDVVDSLSLELQFPVDVDVEGMGSSLGSEDFVVEDLQLISSAEGDRIEAVISGLEMNAGAEILSLGLSYADLIDHSVLVNAVVLTENGAMTSFEYELWISS